MNLSEVRVGQTVSWESQGCGSRTTKVGVVIAVCRRSAYYKERARAAGVAHAIRRCDYWGPVVVMCTPIGKRGKPLTPRIYSPRVAGLSVVADDTPHEAS